jgi:hypothetical protein
MCVALRVFPAVSAAADGGPGKAKSDSKGKITSSGNGKIYSSLLRLLRSSVAGRYRAITITAHQFAQS